MEPLKPQQTKDAVLGLLRDEIFSGALPDGTELVQELLAEKLGVSRMPVREALQQLELEGILQRLPNRHMRVAGVTPRSVRQAFSMLAAVETELAALALREALPFTAVLEAAARYRESPGPERELLLHTSLAGCLQNPGLCRLHERLSGGHFAYTLRHRKRAPTLILPQVKAFSTALRQKNLPRLEQILRAYCDEAAQDALATIGGDQLV